MTFQYLLFLLFSLTDKTFKVLIVTGMLCYLPFIGKSQIESYEKWNFLSSEKFDDRVRGEKNMRIAFYNVENLFDPFDDSLTVDEAFTPEGDYRWTYGRYLKKLDDVGKTILALGGWEPPTLVGFCEVENKMVLIHLLKKTCLKSSGYQIIHRDSPDRRGIDVAAIYRPDKFTLIDLQYLPVTFPFQPSSTTREVLFARGLLPNKDTLHFFVNHWPSRRGGQRASEPRRMEAAKVVRDKIDSIFLASPQALIVVTGDFNDEPEDRSLKIGLRSKNPEHEQQIVDTTLYNLMEPLMHKTGTHSYQGHWGILDQFMVSSAFFDGPTRIQNVQIFNKQWLLKENAAGETVPNRTFQGPMYKGGFSDHLPILLDIQLKD